MTITRSGSKENLELDLCPRTIKVNRGGNSITLEQMITLMAQCRKYKERVEIWKGSTVVKTFTLPNGTFHCERVYFDDIQELMIMKSPSMIKPIIEEYAIEDLIKKFVEKDLKKPTPKPPKKGKGKQTNKQT